MSNISDELDDILAALANYIVESIQLQPTSVKYRKLNQKQAKRQINALITKAYWQGNQKAIIEESKKPRTTICGICGELQAELYPKENK